MFQNQPQPRPSMPERLARVLERGELNELIEALKQAYERTHDEGVLRVLVKLEFIKNDEISQERHWQEEDFAELVDNLNRFPHSIRTWVLDYLEKEQE